MLSFQYKSFNWASGVLVKTYSWDQKQCFLKYYCYILYYYWHFSIQNICWLRLAGFSKLKTPGVSKLKELVGIKNSNCLIHPHLLSNLAEDCCKEDGITEDNEDMCFYTFCVKELDCVESYDGFETFKHALCKFYATLINTEEDLYYDGY